MTQDKEIKGEVCSKTGNTDCFCWKCRAIGTECEKITPLQVRVEELEAENKKLNCFVSEVVNISGHNSDPRTKQEILGQLHQATGAIGEIYQRFLQEHVDYDHELEKRVKKLEETLNWYADVNRYGVQDWIDTPEHLRPEYVMDDVGSRARKALKETPHA